MLRSVEWGGAIAVEFSVLEMPRSLMVTKTMSLDLSIFLFSLFVKMDSITTDVSGRGSKRTQTKAITIGIGIEIGIGIGFDPEMWRCRFGLFPPSRRPAGETLRNQTMNHVGGGYFGSGSPIGTRI